VIFPDRCGIDTGLHLGKVATLSFLRANSPPNLFKDSIFGLLRRPVSSTSRSRMRTTAADRSGCLLHGADWSLKPSRGRVSDPLDVRELAELVVSRTVRDTAAVLDAVHGSEPGDL
jgi:hypothetical protein